MMPTFGTLLRIHRRGCQDPQKGGLLTQDRLGELIGLVLGDAGYSGAAISDWERDKSKINEDDRLVLVTLTKVLHRYGGLNSPSDADRLLAAGNYRRLDPAERRAIFPDEPLDHLDNKPVESGPRQGKPARRADAAPSRQRRKQLILLEKVNRFWVDGVLSASIQPATMLQLDWDWYPQAIDHPWDRILLPPTYGQDAPAAILETFTDADRALLIMGQPGSGKTTTLLTLARELVDKAEKDLNASIPVILSLASWAEQRLKLVDWLVEELTAKYQIPRQIGREWLADDALVLLLDGFDEVPARQRTACAEAINHFREGHGLSGIVVCSRLDEYLAAGCRLRFGGAVAIRSLTTAQIDHYLQTGENRLLELRQVLADDAALRESVQSPLMLNVMALTYADETEGLPDPSHHGPLSELEIEDSAPGRQQRLFGAYVSRMFQQHAWKGDYDGDQTRQWLAWLARKMRQYNQPVFLIEQIQPSWLPSRKWRWLYLTTSGLILGAVGGLIMWLLLELLRQTTPQLPAGTAMWFAQRLYIGQALAEILTLAVGNVILGLVTITIIGYLFERRLIQSDRFGSREQQRWLQVMMVGLAVGFLTTATEALNNEFLLALAWGIAEAVLYMTAARYVFGWNYSSEVRTVEALGWSWKSAAKGLVVGLILAVTAEAIEALLYTFDGVWRTTYTLSAAGFILGGLRGRRVEAKNNPNQGIWLSFLNSLLVALLTGLLLGGLTALIRPLSYALMIGALMALISGSLLGGSNVVKHLLIRSMLIYCGRIPVHLIRFLDYTAGLILLRKVGGGYMFTHNLLQEYFAADRRSWPLRTG